MVPTNSITVFLRHNDSQLRYLVTSISSSLQYAGPTEDLVQDLYLKFLTTDILESYNQNYHSGTGTSSRLSTYLYPIIRNHILSHMKSKDYKYVSGRVPNFDPYSNEDMELEDILKNTSYCTDYKELVEYNEACDRPDGINFEMKLFQEKFKKSKENRKFSLKKRGGVHKKIPECSLMDIFKYLYKGYSNKEIAEVYGVSNMTITHLKHKLAISMIKMGFYPEGLESKIQDILKASL